MALKWVSVMVRDYADSVILSDAPRMRIPLDDSLRSKILDYCYSNTWKIQPRFNKSCFAAVGFFYRILDFMYQSKLNEIVLKNLDRVLRVIHQFSMFARAGLAKYYWLNSCGEYTTLINAAECDFLKNARVKGTLRRGMTMSETFSSDFFREHLCR
jgi:hypothetical protein